MSQLGIMLFVAATTLMIAYYIALVSITLTKPEIVMVEVINQSAGGRGGCLKWVVRFADGSESTRFCINKSIRITSPKTMARVRLKQTWIADEIVHVPLEDDGA